MERLYAALRALDLALARLSRGRVRLWALRFYLQPVPERPLLAPARNSRIRIGLLGRNEIDTALFERPQGAIEERFDSGSECIAALDEGRLAGFMWLHFGPLRERMFACDFEPFPPESVCWDYDFEIAPHYRLGRTFARLWDEAFRLLRDRGVRGSVSWVHFWNLESQRAHERMGAQPVGWLLMLDVFDFKLALQSGRGGIRFVPRGRRMLVRVDADAAPTAAHRPERAGQESSL